MTWRRKRKPNGQVAAEKAEADVRRHEAIQRSRDVERIRDMLADAFRDALTAPPRRPQ